MYSNLTEMKKSILLIQPNYNIKKDATIWMVNPPLGPCYIASVLEQAGYPVEILDANVENYSIAQTIRIIKKKNPDYVGVSILTPAADWSVELIRKLPKNFITIAGGPHSSSLPEELVKRGFSIAVIGEGEQTTLEIVSGRPLETVDGIVYRKKRKIVRTKPRTPVDPNSIPFPARHLIRNGGTDRPYASSGTRYYPWAQLFSSRGCPFSCYFCNKNIFGYHYRPRTPENVLKEIDYLVKTYHVKEIDIYDDNFNFDMKRAEIILDGIIRRKYALTLRFSNGIRADKVSPRLLSKMKKAGTDYIAYGVETGDPDILRSIPKGETHEQIANAVHLTKKAGIQVAGFFILGLIGDTVETMKRTIDFAKNMDFDIILLNIATPYPGTRMWKMILDKGGKIFIQKWVDFHHVSGRMLYTVPGMATPTEVEHMYKRANRDFYFRPKYIMQQIPNIFKPGMIPVMFNGLKRIFYTQHN